MREVDEHTLFSSNRITMLWGLRLKAEQPGVSDRTREVYEALLQPLPDGVSQDMWRFLGVTAGLGLWDILDGHDPRMADVILGYYTSNRTFSDLIGTVDGITSPDVLCQLAHDGVQILWQALPDSPDEHFPLDKQKEFPPKKLRRGIRSHQIAAVSEANRKRWADPSRRAALEEQLRQAAQARRSAPFEQRS
jgi:hypothetical protein